MDPKTHKVVDFAITQKGEVTGDLEKACCKILLEQLINKDLEEHGVPRYCRKVHTTTGRGHGHLLNLSYLRRSIRLTR